MLNTFIFRGARCTHSQGDVRIVYDIIGDGGNVSYLIKG